MEAHKHDELNEILDESLGLWMVASNQDPLDVQGGGKLLRAIAQARAVMLYKHNNLLHYMSQNLRVTHILIQTILVKFCPLKQTLNQYSDCLKYFYKVLLLYVLVEKLILFEENNQNLVTIQQHKLSMIQRIIYDRKKKKKSLNSLKSRKHCYFPNEKLNQTSLSFAKSSKTIILSKIILVFFLLNNTVIVKNIDKCK